MFSIILGIAGGITLIWLLGILILARLNEFGWRFWTAIKSEPIGYLAWPAWAGCLAIMLFFLVFMPEAVSPTLRYHLRRYQ